jgi:hypothetical protein
MVAIGALVTLATLLPLLAAKVGLHPPSRPLTEVLVGLITGPPVLVAGLILRARLLRLYRTSSLVVSDDGKWWWDGSQWNPSESSEQDG